MFVDGGEGWASVRGWAATTSSESRCGGGIIGGGFELSAFAALPAQGKSEHPGRRTTNGIVGHVIG